MGWIGFIFASAFFLALYDLAKKASVRDNAVLPTLLTTTSFGGLAFLGATAAAGNFGAMLSPSGDELFWAFSKSLIAALSWLFTFRALKTLPITIATPIRASAPALVVAGAYFCYGEVPSALQAMGMVCTFGGYLAFSWAGKNEGIDFLRSRAVWFAVAGMVCAAGSALWDKYVFQVCAANVERVQFWFQAGLVATYGTLLLAGKALKVKGSRFEWRWTMPAVGALLAVADWFYFKGLATPGVPVSVGTLLRRSSVVVTFVLGAVFFKERNLKRKALALAAIILGVSLLCMK